MPTGASRPIVSYVGMNAMIAVPTIISKIVSVSASRRPRRSAYTPITMAPSGRMKNDTPNVPSVSSNEVVSSCVGKNSFAIVTAKKPYTTRSNHSSALPMDADMTARQG